MARLAIVAEGAADKHMKERFRRDHLFGVLAEARGNPLALLELAPRVRAHFR
jgi:hypothetical protein